MASLSFTLLPEALLQLHDVLVCLAKFNESVSIEAESDFFRLSALNSSKSGYASCTFTRGSFFSQYSFNPRRCGGAASSTTRNNAVKLSCQIYIKALLSVFKGRSLDFKDKDMAVEKGVVQIFDAPDETECRFVIQIICKYGVVKTYKLTYEPVEVQHAVFDKSKTQNEWAIDSKLLREILEYFGPTAEQLDMFTEEGKAIFTSFTTKVTNGKEILKQPVHTSVSIDTKDFERSDVEEKLHLAISVKDFRAIIMHADTLKVTVTARYTRPCRPLQFAYESNGMTCEFTLMTRGESDDPDAASNAGELSARAYSRTPQAVPASNGASASSRIAEAPRVGVAAQSTIQETPLDFPPPGSILADPSSLFVPMDDDRRWDVPLDEEEQDQEDVLGWDPHINDGAAEESIFGDVQNRATTVPETGRQNESTGSTAIPPTQRISQIRTIFD